MVLNVVAFAMNENSRQILRQLLPEANYKLYTESYFYYDYQYTIYSGKLSVLIAIGAFKHHKNKHWNKRFFWSRRASLNRYSPA